MKEKEREKGMKNIRFNSLQYYLREIISFEKLSFSIISNNLFTIFTIDISSIAIIEPFSGSFYLKDYFYIL